MPKIPLSVIEEIKYRSDIEDVISRYLTLKRVGSNFTALCPFHSERTPSFTVFPSTQNFYCFGCGVGGDVISFIMRIENLDYVSALRYLAERAGVTIPEEIGSNGGETVSRQRILDMNRDAARFYRDSLFNGKYGDAGMKYLLQRGVPPPIIKRFGLGFAPDSFDAMSSHMHSLGYTDTELAAGFLRGVSRNTGKHFDMFRGRVMFPIIDTQNRVIAFGGRAIGNAEPKYLNSSDTVVFKKSRNLFALNFARRHCAEELILCEGYMDVIALHAAGFENAIATLGTALTPEQARLMKKYTKRVIINYDSDDAGQRAANRAIEILNEVGLEVRILRLSGAKDPDEYIKKYGADKFRLALSGSRT
ncbi:MAG TPA: DNA primase, partial [Bacillota bacterium]|nr:DNA primase [Bacillota bacterium]